MMSSTKHRPLAWLAFWYSIGILASSYVPVGLSSLWLITSFCLVLVVLSLQKRILPMVLLSVFFGGLGLLAIKSHLYLEPKHISSIARYYYKDTVSVKGKVISDTIKRKAFNGEKTTFTFRIEEIKKTQPASFKKVFQWRKSKGKLLVHIFQEGDIRYGDHLILEGTLHRPFNFSPDEKFSYKDYLRRKGIMMLLSVGKKNIIQILARDKGSIVKATALRLRNRCKQIFNGYLTPHESGIMRAIILGDRSRIPSHIKELFVRTGTVHVLAISGLHMAIVTVLILVLLKITPWGRKSQLIITALLLIGYAFLTGGRPSVIRATIMTVVFLMSFVLEKETDVFNTISFAALTILLMNPMTFFDVGFQLSFICVFSIILFQPKIKNVLDRLIPQERLHSVQARSSFQEIILQSLSISLAVWLGVAGLIAYYYEIVTPITVWANLIIVPLMSAVVTLGIGLLLAGGLVPVVGLAFAASLKVVLNVMVAVVFVFDKVPYAYVPLQGVTWIHVLGYYLLLLVMFYCPFRRLFLLNFRGKASE